MNKQIKHLFLFMMITTSVIIPPCQAAEEKHEEPNPDSNLHQQMNQALNDFFHQLGETKAKELEENRLKSLISDNGTIKATHLETFWTTSSKMLQILKVKGALNDDMLYDLMQRSTHLKYVDIHASYGLSDLTKQILSIFFNQTPEILHLKLGVHRVKTEEKIIAALGRAITRNTSLTKLDLSQNYGMFDTTTIRHIAQGVLANSTLKEFSMECCKLGNDGAKEFLEVLTTNSTLTTLDLGGNNEYDESATIDLYRALSKNPNTALTRFEVACCSVDTPAAREIANFIATNTTLTTLDLKQAIPDVGIIAIAKALETNRTLTKLIIHSDRMSDVGVTEIAKMMVSNTSITYLQLYSNKEAYITNPSALAMTEALKKNTPLKYLMIGSRAINREGIESLLSSLTINTTLTDLNLSYCYYGFTEDVKTYKEKLRGTKPNGICTVMI